MSHCRGIGNEAANVLNTTEMYFNSSNEEQNYL